MKEMLFDLLIFIIATAIWELKKQKSNGEFNLKKFIRNEIVIDGIVLVILATISYILTHAFGEEAVDMMHIFVFAIVAVITGIVVWKDGVEKEKIDFISDIIVVAVAILIYYVICY